MTQPAPGSLEPPIPIWLKALGIVALTAIGAAAAYAVVIGAQNFAKIGV